MSNDAIIGYTGFVGGSLHATHNFTGLYNSKNIGEIAGKSYDTIYCAGAPAVKWLANKEPEKDFVTISGLLANIRSAKAKRIILISTVDVYQPPINVNEDTEPQTETLHAYGKNRLYLENELKKSFEVTILRLPGLFGKGLKKNVIFDFLTGNAVDKVESRSVFQFYDLSNLSRDIARTLEHKIPLINIATEPVSVAEVIREGFGKEFKNELTSPPARYDFHTIHSALWNAKAPYLYSKKEVLAALKTFVQSWGK